MKPSKAMHSEGETISSYVRCPLPSFERCFDTFELKRHPQRVPQLGLCFTTRVFPRPYLHTRNRHAPAIGWLGYVTWMARVDPLAPLITTGGGVCKAGPLSGDFGFNMALFY